MALNKRKKGYVPSIAQRIAVNQLSSTPSNLVVVQANGHNSTLPSACFILQRMSGIVATKTSLLLNTALATKWSLLNFCGRQLCSM